MQSGKKSKVLPWRLSIVSDENHDKLVMPVGAPDGIQTLHLPNKSYLFGKTVTSYN